MFVNFASATSAIMLTAAPCLYPATSASGLSNQIIASEVMHPLRPTAVGWVDAQLKMLASLPQGWDGYRAMPISVDRLNQMGAILKATIPAHMPRGSIVPGADGSLQAEWHFARSSLGLIIENKSALSVWVQPQGEPEIERTGSQALDLFKAAALSAML